MPRMILAAFALCASAATTVQSAESTTRLPPSVTAERLSKGTAETASWLMYGGDYRNWRHSPSTTINRDNVQQLKAAWIFQTGVPGQLEAAPIVADGVMYLTASYNHLFALDAATGELLWAYQHDLPGDLRLCCGPANRGVAIADDKVFMATLDARLLAFDRVTGKLLWNVQIEDYAAGYSGTSAPLVVGGLVVTGIAGGEYGARGFVDAYDVATGGRKWRRYTVPEAGEPGVDTWSGESWKTGGGPTWTTGTYDPERDILYWATGNPAPDWNGDARKGDNLYTNSVLALDPATGAIKWHFQFTPHDVWDYDGNTGLFIIDLTRDGRKVRTVAQPNRNGYFYLLDAATGRFLQGTQYVDKLNWSTGLDAGGRPQVDPKFTPAPGGTLDFICPGNVGGQNGSYTASFSPATGLVYVPVVESCGKMQKADAQFTRGEPFWGGSPGVMDGEDQSSYGHLSAIDPATGKIAWRHEDEYPLIGGTLTTAGGLVFSGTQNGYAIALDDTTGKLLWRFQTGSAVRGQPVSYEFGGRQFVAIGSGGGGLAAALVGEPPLLPKGSALVVFTLP